MGGGAGVAAGRRRAHDAGVLRPQRDGAQRDVRGGDQRRRLARGTQLDQAADQPARVLDVQLRVDEQRAAAAVARGVAVKISLPGEKSPSTRSISAPSGRSWMTSVPVRLNSGTSTSQPTDGKPAGRPRDVRADQRGDDLAVVGGVQQHAPDRTGGRGGDDRRSADVRRSLRPGPIDQDDVGRAVRRQRARRGARRCRASRTRQRWRRRRGRWRSRWQRLRRRRKRRRDGRRPGCQQQGQGAEEHARPHAITSSSL